MAICEFSGIDPRFCEHCAPKPAPVVKPAGRAALVGKTMSEETLRLTARSMLDAQGLSSWKLRFGRWQTLWGHCSYITRTISLNFALLDAPLAEIESTIIHEVAHALCFLDGRADAGHGPIWKAKCAELGLRDARAVGGRIEAVTA